MKALVFDIGGTFLKYASCSDGLLSDVQRIPTEADKGGRHILDTLISLIRQEKKYDAIGISTAGQVDFSRGSILFANENIPEYTGMNLRQELERRFHVHVIVENDVNCAAMGEAAYGAGKGYPSFLCLTFGTGVGGAVIENNCLYRGSTFSAGEFGAIITHPEARKSADSFFEGCYERYASTSALVRMAAAYDPELTDGQKIFSRLNDKNVHNILENWIDEIVFGLITLVHIFNPACIVLGGGIMEQSWLPSRIQEKLHASVMPNFRNVILKPAALGNRAGLMGIYCLVQQGCLKKERPPLL